jgi:Tol biopolymer transport system component
MYLNCFKALKQDDYLKMIVAVLWLSLPCSVAQADIYYSAKVFGPVVNIHAIDEQGQVKKITNNNRWRDVEHDVASNGLISFASNRKSNGSNVNLHRQENYQIFLKQTKTDELVQVSLGYEQARKPKFSPGNDKLAFIALEGQQQSLIIYDLATKATKRLQSAKFIYDFSWSPDDQHIAVSSQHEKSAALVIVDSKDLSTKVIVNGSINQSTTLKSIPKNKQPAIETSEQLNHVITKQVEQLFVAPTWSPNGNYIAYISHPLTKQSTRVLMVYQLAGQKIQRISVNNIQVQAPITWSSTSDSLLYSALVNYQQYYDESTHKKVYLGGMHIFNSDLIGNNQQLTKGDHLFKQPVFSPNEKHIAYFYADKLNARTLQLNTMLADGSKQQKLSDSIAKNAALQWH